MVIDHIKHADAYRGLGPGIAAALDYLTTTDLAKLKTGDVQLADGVVVKVVDYETNPPERKRWEAHRKCVDVHLLVAGEELFGYADVSTLEPVTEYDEQEDVIMLEQGGQGECEFVRLTPGTFAIAYPQDAHKPGIVADAKGLVRKIVVKLPV